MITELVAVDIATNPDTAHLLLAIFSAAGNYADSAAYSEIGGTGRWRHYMTNFPQVFILTIGPHIRGTEVILLLVLRLSLGARGQTMHN